MNKSRIEGRIEYLQKSLDKIRDQERELTKELSELWKEWRSTRTAGATDAADE